MKRYRRAYQAGGWYFFTVVTYGREKILTHPKGIERLREAFQQVMGKHPFSIDGIVVLPDHIHCLWRLPEDDADFSVRWRLIKRHYSIGFDAAVTGRREKRIWQPRFWEHLIRDEEDWRRHMDYVHYNPVKHGYVNAAGDWPYSSFKNAVKRGWYPANWGSLEPETISGMDMEYEYME